MNSSMLAGERRWATARRGGMTVLGKVAVPKPLNLPSQRLENHGLDPNVEIVPKGTLSWGSRPSSSGSNAWVAPAPNADGGTSSPSHRSGRPSSGGSGTRPSTAGSDRTYEPVTNAWGSNSRPSSASGSLTSNQTSLTSLRPRSAETRPNSSQLSRFAEPVSESSVAWTASSTAERLGAKSSKEDGFSLSSGDFPTLGSDKENSVKNIESRDYDRPSSASGRIAQAKEDTRFHGGVHHGTMNTLRTDGSLNAEDGIYPSVENWQGEPQQYFNAKVSSQHFDALRNPPINTPNGAWYRGRPGRPTFGAPVAPGGFPMEPFPYYHPQIPPPAVGGSQPVPPPGTGPRGPHPKNGDLYRPQLPDAYARPGMPFRPGFYRGPPAPPGPMTFEGYYGPPMGYCHNEQEIPFMGMPARPPVYNGYPAPGALDHANSHGRASGHGTSGRTLPEQAEADHQGHQRVPLKNHNNRDRKEEGGNWEQDVQSNVSHPGKSILPMITSGKKEWGAEEDGDRNIFAKRTMPGDNSSCNSEYQEHSSERGRVKSFEGMGSAKAVNNNWTNKYPSVASFPPEMPQLAAASERNPSLPPATKDPALMQKLEGLNAKVRASDGQCAAPNAFNREERRSRSQVEMKINNYAVEVSSTGGSFERAPISVDLTSVPHQEIGPGGNNTIHPTAVVSRSSYPGGQVRFDQRGKGKLNCNDADGWGMKPLPPEPSGVMTSSTKESVSNNHGCGPNIVGKTAEISALDSVGKLDGESFAETCDSSYIQRAKMREVAKQRALQLQREEEERTREQKAKAFAKLEELNRRTQAGEVANQKAETTQSFSDIEGEQEESWTLGESVLVDPKFQAHQNLVSDSLITALERDSSTCQSEDSVDMSKHFPLETPQAGLLEIILPHGQSLRMKEDDHNANAGKIATQLNDGGIFRRIRAGYKQKPNNSLQKTLIEKSVVNVACEAPKDLDVDANDTVMETSPSEIQSSSMPNVPNTSNTVAEPALQQRRKSSTRKSKQKLDEAPEFPSLSPVLSDSNTGKEFVESGESKTTLSNLDALLSTVTVPNKGAPAAEVFSSLPNEEANSRVTNPGRHQLFRRTSRSQQSNKYMDKLHGNDTVIWAPVRTQNKSESGIEVSKQSALESGNATNSDTMAQNSSKSKRAEMERYVPKPVAKELAQQGSTPPMPSSVNSSKSDDASGRVQSGTVGSESQPVSSAAAFVGSSIEIKEGDDRHNKHKKEHGTWRLRGSADSSHMKGGVRLGSSPIFEPTKDIKKATEHQFVKSVINSGIAETNTSRSIDASDGYNTSNSTTSSAVGKIPTQKDQGPTVRGKRHQSRVPRSTGDIPDRGDILSGETDGIQTQSAAPDVDQTDRPIASKENRSYGERTSSHWQPKSNSNANSQQGNKTAGSETVTTEITKASKKDHPSQHKMRVPPQNDKQNRNAYRPQPGQSVFENNVAGESIVGRHHQEFNREKKPSPAKEPPYSLNPDPVDSTESVPSANSDFLHEHNIPSGSRRGGKQNSHSRSVRGHEARGDWFTGQDNRPTHAPAFRERHRQNAQYEYQPVGPYKNSEPEKLDELADGANDVGPRYRERGQTHPKRGGGNFYR